MNKDFIEAITSLVLAIDDIAEFMPDSDTSAYEAWVDSPISEKVAELYDLLDSNEFNKLMKKL